MLDLDSSSVSYRLSGQARRRLTSKVSST